MKKLRILVVDNSPIFLMAVVDMLTELSSIDIVGQAASGAEALILVAQTKPDLVLTDMAMPHMDGLELTRRLLQAPNPPQVVIMTAHTEPQYRVVAATTGVAGFVLKANLSAQLPTLLQRLKQAAGP